MPDPHRELFELLERAAAEQVFPGCVALVWRDGAELYHEAHGVLATHRDHPERDRGVQRGTIYDLASLTKVLATTSLVALAVEAGELDLDAPVPEPWGRACPGARLYHLLAHSAGVPAHVHFYAEPGVRGAEEVLARVAKTAPASGPGERAVYSDLGFMILGAWLERRGGAPLERLFEDRVAWPLGLHGGAPPRLAFRRRGPGRGVSAAEARAIAPTEVYDPSLHAEVPDYFACRRSSCAHGEVHDDNAWVMGGVAGHAGLFGDAAAVLEVALAWLGPGLPGLGARVRDRFWAMSEVPGSTRRLGWDSPNPDGSGSAADVLSARAVGHTGFTGTSLWIDPAPPDRRGPLIAVLLSNRVHPTRESPRIAGLRQAFHRAAVRL